MDPISIVGLVDASIDLALKFASAVKRMNDIASKYKKSELTLRSIAQNLETMQFAWDRIGAWTQSYTPNESADDDGFVLRMAHFLETGTLVMDALEEELLPFSDETLGFAQRAKLVWNENTFLDHQSRIRDQTIPTPKDRGNLIRKSEKQFKESDESAYSIVPSRMSISTRQTDGQESARSEDDMVYRRLSFEDDLFTARVYKRNYRNAMLVQLLKTKSSEKTTSRERAGHAHISHSHEVLPDSVISQGQESMHRGSVQGARFTSIRTEQWHKAAIQDTRRRQEELSTFELASELLWNLSDGSETDFEDAVEDETLDPRSTLLTRKLVWQRLNFMNACNRGNYDTVQKFLKMWHIVHSQQANQDSPGFRGIHAAAMHGHIEIVQVLLQHGASVEDRTIRTGSRPLHLAAKLGNARMVELLLGYGAHIGAENKFREQPIHLAAKFGSIEVLRILVDKGATVDCSDEARRQPLHYAAEFSDRPDVVEFLVKAGADINDWTLNERPLNIACRRNHIGNVRALLTLGAGIGQYPNHSNPLYTAIMHGSLAALEALLEHRMHLNSLGDWVVPAVHISIDLRANNLRAAKKSLRLLLRYHADINAQDENGDTALHKLARLHPRRLHDGQLLLARILLDNNADCDAQNLVGHTPLHLAIEGHQHDISNLLINSGARFLCVSDDYTLCLQVHDPMYDVLCWFLLPPYFEGKMKRDRYDYHVRMLRKVLENLSASEIPVRVVRYNYQSEDEFVLRRQSKYTDSHIMYMERVIARTQGLLDQDQRVRAVDVIEITKDDN